MFQRRSQFRHDPRPCRQGSRAAAPGSTSSLRTANRHRVLDVLRDDAGVFTQAELARATGLAPATVSSLVRELSEEGLVETEPGSGRRGSAVRLSRETGIVAGIDFGHSHLAVAVGDLSGRILGEYRRRLDDGVDHHQMLADARSMLDSVRVGAARSARSGSGCPPPSPATSSSPPRSSRAGRASTPARSPRTCSASPCTSRTTPTSAPSPSTAWAPAGATTAAST